MKKLLVIVTLMLCLDTSRAHAQDNDNACPVALVTTSFAVCTAICLTLDTCVRYRRGDFKNNTPLSRVLTATTTGTIAASLAAAASAFHSCSK
jgi:hypothetical protein